MLRNKGNRGRKQRRKEARGVIILQAGSGDDGARASPGKDSAGDALRQALGPRVSLLPSSSLGGRRLGGRGRRAPPRAPLASGSRERGRSVWAERVGRRGLLESPHVVRLWVEVELLWRRRPYPPSSGEEKNQDECQDGQFVVDGMELLKDVTDNKRFLPTGLQGIDALLGGGLRQGQLTEITGQSSSGKTQVCLCSASHVAARELGVVMYLDTSNSFSPSRIARIVDRFPISFVREPKNVRLERVMSSIICKSVFDIFDLFEVLHQLELSLKNKVNNGSSKICLLIIDSVSSLLAPINGWSMMISVAMTLKKLADEHNLSVLVTNHMVAGNRAPKPALGESWKTVPHVRLVISHERGSNICAATVLKHTLLALGHVMKFAVPS